MLSNCLQCGAEFEQKPRGRGKGRNKLYCNESCRSKKYYTYYKNKEKLCGCGATINFPSQKCDKCKDKRRRNKTLVNRARKYSLKNTDILRMLLNQDHKCPICECTISLIENNFHIDHDHKCCSGEKSCGKCVRGLLCNKCNPGLAWFNEDRERIANTLNYLDFWKVKE